MGRPRAPTYDPYEIPWHADFLAKVLAAVSAVSFSVSVLLMVAVTDPVTVDLLGRFVPRLCSTVRSLRTRGATTCASWSSCRQACADPPVLYSCIHIHVGVIEPGPNITQENDLMENTTTPRPPKHEARLLVNAAGCGYELNCSNFYHTYGEIGVEFPCLFNPSTNRAWPLDSIEDSDPWTSILLPFAPLSLSALCLLVLCVRGFCDLPRMIPKHVLLRLLKERRQRVARQIRMMQQRRDTPASHQLTVDWKRRLPPPAQIIRLQAEERGGDTTIEDDLVLSNV